MSLFPKPFTIERVTRALIQGIYVDGPATLIPLEGTVQPLSGEDLANLEPASRTIGKVWIRTTAALRKRQDNTVQRADVLIHDGQRWEIISDQHFNNGLIPHHKYLAEYRGVA